jgi:tetratricopeptide (TPR) repeat protein
MAFSQDDHARQLALGPARARYDRARLTYGPDSPQAVAAMAALGAQLAEQQDWAEATELLEKAHETVRRHLGPHSPQALGILTRLTAVYLGQGETGQARSALRHLLADHGGPVAGTMVFQMASIVVLASLREGEYDDAREMAERIITTGQIPVDEEPDASVKEMVLIAKGNLAEALRGLGRVASARQFQEEVLAERIRQGGEDNPDTLTAMNNLASTIALEGNLGAARPLREAVLAKRRVVLGDDDRDTVSAMHNLAQLMSEQGELSEARTLEEKVVEYRRRILGDDAPETNNARNTLALILAELGELEQARRIQRAALASYQQSLGPGHPSTLVAMNNLALMTEPVEARNLLEQVVTERRRLLPGHPDTINSMSVLAALLGQQGLIPAAQALHREAYEAARAAHGDNHPITQEAKKRLAKELWDDGDAADALRFNRPGTASTW